WDDARLGMRHFSSWDRVALVTEVPWLRAAATAMGFAIPAEFRLFRLAEQEEALRWIAEPAA
ncbi:MAG: STAS/SEC14 domain-containing protein, partial [Rhodanobacter sp.]